MNYSHPALVQHLAAQYVLGTLQPGARRRMVQLLAHRVDLQLAVQDWQQCLGTLDRQVAVDANTPPASYPSSTVWQAIEARTGAALMAPDTKNPTAQPTGWLAWLPWLSRPWGRAVWGGNGLGAGLATGIATGLIAASALFKLAPAIFTSTDKVAMQDGERLPQSYVGLMTDAQGAGKVLVSSLRYGKIMTIKMIGVMASAPEGSRFVVWAVPKEGAAFMLGTLPAKGSATSQLPDTSDKLLAKVTTLIVTRETTPNPVSPSVDVVLRGNCAKLW